MLAKVARLCSSPTPRITLAHRWALLTVDAKAGIR